MPQAGTNLGRDSQSRVCRAKERPSPDGTAVCDDSLSILGSLGIARMFILHVDNKVYMLSARAIIHLGLSTVFDAFRQLLLSCLGRSLVRAARHLSRVWARFASSWTLSSPIKSLSNSAVSVCSLALLLSNPFCLVQSLSLF